VADKRRARRVLFVQVTEPGIYPPLIHASAMMAEAGFDVAFLAAPYRGMKLTMPHHPRIAVHRIRPRPGNRVGKPDYFRYAIAVSRLARAFRPDVVYASDPLGAGPGLLAARLAGARLVYHEHDSFAPGARRSHLARMRAAAARRADLIIFPNAERAHIAEADLGFPADRLRIVWNLPRLREVQPAVPPGPATSRLIAYYHGSLSPDRLPETLVDSLAKLAGRVRLHIAGYEIPGAPGYVEGLVERGRAASGGPLVEYLGQLPERKDLLKQAAQAHVGLAFMPRGSTDINMRNMTGASNKPFDYMASGLALLVSDLPDWRDLFVPAYGRACDPADAESIAEALAWFADHPHERREMAARGRFRIGADWNYETAFAPVLADITRLC
jgi:glycosyltransferase involved in cell wall biosynthesis